MVKNVFTFLCSEIIIVFSKARSKKLKTRPFVKKFPDAPVATTRHWLKKIMKNCKNDLRVFRLQA